MHPSDPGGLFKLQNSNLTLCYFYTAGYIHFLFSFPPPGQLSPVGCRAEGHSLLLYHTEITTSNRSWGRTLGPRIQWCYLEKKKKNLSALNLNLLAEFVRTFLGKISLWLKSFCLVWSAEYFKEKRRKKERFNRVLWVFFSSEKNGGF